MASLWCLLGPSPAAAHDMRAGAISLREVEPNLFAVRISAARDARGHTVPLRAIWPDGCRPRGGRLACPDGLRGPVTIPALSRRRTRCLVAVQWLDGRRFEVLLAPGEARATVPERGGGDGGVVVRYLALGAEHIALGPDHVLFVVALVIILGRIRPIAVAVTGFTVAHSLTLGAAALGVVAPAGPAVELLIAGSVLWLAREAVVGDGSVTRRPWLMVIPFGLLHGLGFAGALGELGLPADRTLAALAAFNVGVELAQLAIVAAAFGLVKAAPRARAPIAWLTGAVAGYWTLDRALTWFATLS